MVRNKHNTPGIIKYPFWQIMVKNPNVTMLVSIVGRPFAPRVRKAIYLYRRGYWRDPVPDLRKVNTV